MQTAATLTAVFQIPLYMSVQVKRGIQRYWTNQCIEFFLCGVIILCIVCVLQKSDLTSHFLLFSLLQNCFPSYSCRFLKLSLYKDSWNIQIFFFINSSTVNVYIIDDFKSRPYKHIPQNFNGKIITPETNTTTYVNDSSQKTVLSYFHIHVT